MCEKSEIYVEFCPQKVLKYSSYIFFSPKGAKKSQPKKYEVRTITVRFITLGCKTNIYESEAMAQLFEKSGHTVVPNGCADIIVVNTCTVTGTGASKSIKLIRRARRENPNAVLAVTGCLAQTEADRLRAAENIDVLIGTSGRREIVKLCEDAAAGKKTDSVGDILHETSFEELGIVRGQHRIRAEIKIEDGCNNFCSYCKIPYARGPVRSRDIKNIADEATAIADDGYREIVLTGIHIGSYGKDLSDGTGLIDVMETVHRCAPDLRLRLGSIEPVMITESFTKRAAALDNLCPQFHLSLQSGCDKTLAAMRRHYTTADFRTAVQNLRAAFDNAAITTDLIVGFPGESDEDFEQSKAFCEEMRFSQMHIFPYSKREGTLAAKLSNHIGDEIKTHRTHIMLGVAAAMKSEFCKSRIGKCEDVLFEQIRGGLWSGRTKNYIEVRCECNDDLKGMIKPIKLVEYIPDGEYMLGEIIE